MSRAPIMDEYEEQAKSAAADRTWTTPSPSDVLTAWRLAEQRLSLSTEGTAAWRRGRQEARRLARAYQAAFAERKDEAAEVARPEWLRHWLRRGQSITERS